MTLEGDMTTLITADVAVKAVIEDRMFPLVAPKASERPFVSYARTATELTRVHAGSANHAVASFRLTCWSLSYDASMALAVLVRAVIDNEAAVWGATTVQRCFVESESDELEPSPELLDLQLIGRNLDVEIAYVV